MMCWIRWITMIEFSGGENCWNKHLSEISFKGQLALKEEAPAVQEVLEVEPVAPEGEIGPSDVTAEVQVVPDAPQQGQPADESPEVSGELGRIDAGNGVDTSEPVQTEIVEPVFS